LRHFILKPIISPRQARDNYRENSKDEFLQDEIEKFFGGWATPVSATDGAGTPGSATDGGGGGSGDSSRVAALSFDDEFDPRAAVRKTRPAPFSFSNYPHVCPEPVVWQKSSFSTGGSHRKIEPTGLSPAFSCCFLQSETPPPPAASASAMMVSTVSAPSGSEGGAELATGAAAGTGGGGGGGGGGARWQWRSSGEDWKDYSEHDSAILESGYLAYTGNEQGVMQREVELESGTHAVAFEEMKQVRKRRGSSSSCVCACGCCAVFS
jgi:hypothetical protein